MSTAPIPTADSFLQIRGGNWATFDRSERAEIVEQAFTYWRDRGFPYYRLTPKEARQEFSRLREKDWKAVFTASGLHSTNVGVRLANAFQPAIWKVRVHRFRSPMDVFRDDDLLRKAIERSLTIWPERFGANAACLRGILKTFPDTASVSNYKPMVAKAVMAKYSEGGPIVDFSAGYGGRLLGALALNRSYIGIEPNKAQIAGCLRMTKALSRFHFSLPEIQLMNGVAEEELSHFPNDFAELVFSSPPYFNWERYSESRNQSFKRFPGFEEWRTRFLEPVIAESYRILKNQGHLVLNVTNGNRLPSATHVKAAARSVGFRFLTVHKMVLRKVPYLHPRNGKIVKTELLLVFRK
jgi:SAM-dependent methyltransferase